MNSDNGFSYEQFSGGRSLYDFWEHGEECPFLPPPSVSDQDYRGLLVQLATKYTVGAPATILSIGAGNGFTELDLKDAGFSVLATDVNSSALTFCSQKGLETAVFDILQDDPPPPRRFALLLCDGVLGHLWTPSKGLAPFWERASGVLIKGGVLITSNDLADNDREPNYSMTADPNAMFFRPPSGWFLRDAETARGWLCEHTETVVRTRGTRGKRRREILVLSHPTGRQSGNT